MTEVNLDEEFVGRRIAQQAADNAAKRVSDDIKKGVDLGMDQESMQLSYDLEEYDRLTKDHNERAHRERPMAIDGTEATQNEPSIRFRLKAGVSIDVAERLLSGGKWSGAFESEQFTVLQTSRGVEGWYRNPNDALAAAKKAGHTPSTSAPEEAKQKEEPVPIVEPWKVEPAQTEEESEDTVEAADTEALDDVLPDPPERPDVDRRTAAGKGTYEKWRLEMDAWEEQYGEQWAAESMGD